LHLSPNIISVIETRKLKWARHATCMGRWKMNTQLVENLKEKDHLQDLDVDRV